MGEQIVTKDMDAAEVLIGIFAVVFSGKICLRNSRPVRHKKVGISKDLPAEEHNFYYSV